MLNEHSNVFEMISTIVASLVTRHNEIWESENKRIVVRQLPSVAKISMILQLWWSISLLDRSHRSADHISQGVVKKLIIGHGKCRRTVYELPHVSSRVCKWILQYSASKKLYANYIIEIIVTQDVQISQLFLHTCSERPSLRVHTMRVRMFFSSPLCTRSFVVESN